MTVHPSPHRIDGDKTVIFYNFFPSKGKVVLPLKKIEKSSLSYAATAVAVAFSSWILPLYSVKYLFFVSVVRCTMEHCRLLSETLSLFHCASVMVDSSRDLARELVNTWRSSKKEWTRALEYKGMISKLRLRQGFLSLTEEAVMGIILSCLGINAGEFMWANLGQKPKSWLCLFDSLFGDCRWCECLRQGGRAIMPKGNACIFGLVIMGC